YIEICPRELAEGTDADEYEFLRYVPDIDGTYDLFSGEEKAPGDRDWVLGLFPVKAAMGEDADGRGGHGTANPDAGFTPVWAMAGLASVTGLFAAIRGSLSFYFPLFVDAVKAYPVWSGAVFVSAVILARLIRTGLVHFVIWWGFSIFTDEKIRQIRILGFLGGPKAVRTLIGFLEDDSMWGSIEQRAAAARALLRINDRKRLKKEFGSDYKAVLSAFVHMGNEDEEKMIALGKSAIPAAAMALNKGPGAPRYEPNMPAIRVLSAIGGPSEIRDLCRSFKSKYIHLHKHFEDFAGLLLEKGDPVILREEFSDDYEQVLKAYIFAEERKWDELEKLGKHATPVLVRILRTNTGREMNTSLIRTVAGIISRIKDPGAMEDAVGYIILILSKFWEPAGMFLRHSHERARDLEEALITLGNPAVIPVLSVLLDERTSVDFRHSAITILSGIDDPGALGGLDHALRHMYAGFRQAAIAGIEGKGEAARAILPTIVNALDDNDKEVRLGAIRAVGNAGSIPEMERLEKFLQDREMNMRKTAAEALIKIYRRSFHKLELVHIEPRLQAYISAGEGDWEKVRSFGKYAFPCLRACMLDTEWENYKAALKCIGKMGPDAREFVPYLVTRIPTLKEDKYSGNRQVIAEALGGLRDQRASDVLVGCLSDKYPGVMAAAAKALGKIKVPRASPKLLELLGSAKNEVRASAAQALLEIDEQGLLRNKLGESYKNVLNAYVLVGEKKWDEAVKLAGDAIPAVVAADKGSDYYFRAKARETFWNILMISKISPE
ncbi:MAG: HEAT repeat domain-containing protein, partial [Candidatus Omnitrophota bacterium]